MLKKIINLILVAVMLLNLVVLALPYWTYGEGETVSVAGYVLVPKDHKGLTTQLREVTGEKKLLTNVAFPLFALLLLNVVGVVISLILLKSRAACLFALCNGAAGTGVFLMDVIVKGQPLWPVCVAVFAVTAVAGLVQLMFFDLYPEEEK